MRGLRLVTTAGLVVLASGCAMRHHQAHLDGRYSREWAACDANSDLSTWYRAPFLVDCAPVAEVVGSHEESAAARELFARQQVGPWTHFHPKLGLLVEKRPDLYLGEGLERVYLGWFSLRVTDRAAFEKAHGPLEGTADLFRRLTRLEGEPDDLYRIVELLERSQHDVADPAPLRAWAEEVRRGLPGAEAELAAADELRALEVLTTLTEQALLARPLRRYVGADLGEALAAIVGPRRQTMSGDAKEGVADDLHFPPRFPYALEVLRKDREALVAWQALARPGQLALLAQRFPGWPCAEAPAAPEPGHRDGLFPTVLARMAQTLQRTGGPEVDAARATSERCVALAVREKEEREAAVKREAASRVELQDSKQRKLLLAAQKGTVAEVKAALAEGSALNEQGTVLATGIYDKAALTVAAYRGSLEIARFLLDAGADVEGAATPKQRTPLLEAAANDRVEMVRLLLDHGARIDRPDDEGTTALAWAKKDDLVELLIARGADVNARDNLQRTPLMRAARDGRLKAVNLLLGAKADVRAHEKAGQGGFTALHYAASYDRRDVITRLVQAGAPLNATDREGSTPLAVAAWSNHLEATHLLLKAGADAEVRNEKGQTPLMKATAEGRRAMVSLLTTGEIEASPVSQPSATASRPSAPVQPAKAEPQGACVSFDTTTSQTTCRDTTAARCSGTFTAGKACTFQTLDPNARHDAWGEGLDRYLRENPTQTPSTASRCRALCIQARCSRFRNDVTRDWNDGGRCVGFCGQTCDDNPRAYR